MSAESTLFTVYSIPCLLVLGANCGNPSADRLLLLGGGAVWHRSGMHLFVSNRLTVGEVDYLYQLSLQMSVISWWLLQRTWCLWCGNDQCILTQLFSCSCVPLAESFIVKKLCGDFAPCKTTLYFRVGIFFLLSETSAISWQHGVNLPSLNLSTCFLVTWAGYGKLVTMLGGYGVHKNSPQEALVEWWSSHW